MLSYFMENQILSIASEKAELVLSKLNLSDSEIVSSEKLVKAIEELTNTRIIVKDYNFEFLKDNHDCGAMMCVAVHEGKKVAFIVLNSAPKITEEFRRFSLFHELGHLATEKYNLANSRDDFTISTHINYDIFRINEEELNGNEYLINEEIANVFALKVLMPFHVLMNKLQFEGIKSVAKFFGVSPKAVECRLALEA